VSGENLKDIRREEVPTRICFQNSPSLAKNRCTAMAGMGRPTRASFLNTDSLLPFVFLALLVCLLLLELTINEIE
jgi:hypothetical protein